MSHFLVYVLVPEVPRDAEHANEMITALLAPFEEEREVFPYQAACNCKDWAIAGVARKAAEDWRPLNAIREEFHARDDVKALREVEAKGWKREATKDEKKAAAEADEAMTTAWRLALADYERVKNDAAAEAAKTAVHDPECEECQGSGFYETTRNPLAKWDWWVVGGRWPGHFLPEQERELALAGRTDLEHLFGRDLGLRGAVATATEALAASTPYALVTPHGEWVGKGQMGWWGMSSGDMPKDEWGARVKATLERFPKATAIAVDCHI